MRHALVAITAISTVLGVSAAVGSETQQPSRECEPWARCSPDAVWLRRALASIGHADVGDTGSALVVGGCGVDGRAQCFVWATPGAGSGCGWRDRRVELGDVAVCGRAVRVHWEAQGRRIWLEPPDRSLLPRLVRASLWVPRLPPKLVRLAPKTLEHCRRSALIRPACPQLVPRVGAPYLSHLARDVARPSQLAVFNLERGGENPADPRRNRPPRMAHLVIAAGDVWRLAPVWSLGTRRSRVEDGAMARTRSHTLAFGRRTWGGRTGRLYLGPPYGSNGGMLGNHLIFRWRDGEVDYVISLHAWEPLTEAASVLRRIVESGG